MYLSVNPMDFQPRRVVSRNPRQPTVLRCDSQMTEATQLPTTAPCTTSASTTAALQRPIRNARVNASLAIAKLSKPTRKRGNGHASSAITPENDTRHSDLVAVSSDKKKTQATTKADYPIKSLTAPLETSVNDVGNTGAQWQVVGRNNSRKKKITRPVTVGTGIINKELQAAERMKFIQAWSFRPDTTTSQVLSFLNNIVGSTKYTVEQRNIRSETHAAFVIGMPEGVYEKVTTPAAWPAKVCFADWFPARPRQQRGAERATISA
ncbi:PHD-finger [Operophtera brumata]|uniref:PHD-finger n=1 Tax=Operophtera brumata TaxID=104452 RepID=A0A0L7LBF6_OPEBR|nr:PHD-finger [Operophtera brumata]